MKQATEKIILQFYQYCYTRKFFEDEDDVTFDIIKCDYRYETFLKMMEKYTFTSEQLCNGLLYIELLHQKNFNFNGHGIKKVINKLLKEKTNDR